MDKPNILIVDDDPGVLYTLQATLEDAEYAVCTAENGRKGLAQLQGENPILILSDLAMPDMDGLAFLEKAKAMAPQIPFIMITAHGSERIAVEAMKKGAFDYLKKPFELQELLEIVNRGAKHGALLAQNRALQAQIGLSHPVIYRSAAMKYVMEMVYRLARRRVNILITGETGTGKEVVARALHDLGPDRNGPFIAFNASTLDGDLLESTLFGHQKGAFTGAVQRGIGLFERAHGGTLFLDEVGDLPLNNQAKLLRALQKGEILPLGASQSLEVDVRVIAATHRDLPAMIAAGQFRADLYYRLNVVPVALPNLGSRRDDIIPLTHHFMARACDKYDLPTLRVADAVLTHLESRAWPGNIRELQNIVERLVLLCDGEAIRAGDLAFLDPNLPKKEVKVLEEVGDLEAIPLRQRMAQFEAQQIDRALTACMGNQSAAARRLQISRGALIDKMQRYGLRGSGTV